MMKTTTNIVDPMTSTEPWVSNANGTVKKEYSWGYPRRNPAFTVHIYESGYGMFENCSTGKLMVAKPEDVNELFAMARKGWAQFKNIDRQLGY